MGILQKIKKNIKEGTFFSNGYKFITNRLRRNLKYNNLFISSNKLRVAIKKIYDDLPKINPDEFERLGN